MSFPKNPRRAGYFRFAGELSPFDFEIFNKESFQFVRIEGQIVHSVQHAKSSMNYRAYAGVGWNFDKDALGKRASLPYYRQYIAGGSNSMRAWGLRQLGIGRSIVSDTTDGFTDRFGDIQFEMNAELRFKLFRLFGFNIGGTLYTDIGNIWNHTNNIDGEGKFAFKNLYYDLAMDIGTGIRWDVSYLVIRLDAAYKVKDPVREGAGWMKTIEWSSKNRLGTVENNNIGFQFGIGYPF
jgi:outer membrane protein assembly factor BamA